jgi:hypothetical protein
MLRTARGESVSHERTERTRRIRKRLHESIPACVAVVDHGDYVGAYVYPEDIPEAEKVVSGSDWEGIAVHVRPTPPVTLR